MRPDTRGRLDAALRAAEGAGAALLKLRGRAVAARSEGDQLKTAIDRAAEGWVVGWLESHYPGERFLCEERFEEGGLAWDAPSSYWTVDALDGTRSYVEGYPGFCVQLARVEDGAAVLGVVHEPAAGRTFWAARGEGAWESGPEGERRLFVRARGGPPVFVDSTRPGGAVGRMMTEWGGEFLECGSIGLKICRVAEGAADVYAKRLRFKLWDAAPGEVILAEAGGRLGLWDGSPVRYDGADVVFEDIAAGGAALFPEIVAGLRQAALPAENIS